MTLELCEVENQSTLGLQTQHLYLERYVYGSCDGMQMHISTLHIFTWCTVTCFPNLVAIVSNPPKQPRVANGRSRSPKPGRNVALHALRLMPFVAALLTAEAHKV